MILNIDCNQKDDGKFFYFFFQALEFLKPFSQEKKHVPLYFSLKEKKSSAVDEIDLQGPHFSHPIGTKKDFFFFLKDASPSSQQ